MQRLLLFSWIWIFNYNLLNYKYLSCNNKYSKKIFKKIESSLSEKEELYSNLNMEDITDSDHNHAKRICKDFEIKYLGEYRDLYLKNDTLLLAVFENFRKMGLEIYDLDSAFSTPRLARQAAFKNIKVKSELLSDTDMLLTAEKRSMSYKKPVNVSYATEYVILLIDMQKLIINIWRILIKIQNFHILNIGM